MTHNKNLKKKYVRHKINASHGYSTTNPFSIRPNSSTSLYGKFSLLAKVDSLNVSNTIFIHTCTFNYHHVHWFTCLGHLPKCCHLPYVTNISLCKLYYMYVQTVLIYWHLNRNKVKETILICTCIKNYFTGKQ